MRTGTASWILLVGAAICGGAGCGGSLSGGVGGTTGTTGTAGSTGFGGSSGPAGTSGAAGGFGNGGAGGSPYYGVTTWGDVRVEVGPTTAAPGTLVLQVNDPRFADQLRTLTFPPSMTWSPNDGAYVGVLFGCGSAAVDRVSLYSCPADGVSGGTITPGCIGLTFDQRGPMGNFIDLDGTPCEVRATSASFLIPAPDFSDPANGRTRYAATGSFGVDCVRGDGTHLDLQGRFMLPVQFSFLIC